MDLNRYFSMASQHKKDHLCGAVPYEHVDMLKVLIKSTDTKDILELGTGIGYSSAAMALVDNEAMVETIEQQEIHLKIARTYWEEMGVSQRIKYFCDKAEAILPELKKEYDFIFFDGYDPSLKFLIHFERLLKKNGLLVTANLFLKDKQGGRYLKQLRDERKWTTAVFSDTAISYKNF